ncbi:MAG: serine--tRNA ligase [Candidatus Doudnabacteria bacterium RIFCSPLOWO2_02_FULL_49_13]|uniref:Serine--tRNA ligase n=1 Tax=Candidatus Doudnabacteria bacterium RIFCSPHIGHO2_12_FULL_48_16 TaxID=1817838 RepID=A0A1F5PID5_9BACT|nr:MAG: serine--tRNA ligase [Candidatus Doudnabacteria bacterium RIFCSPHIGHO2_02_FULL_49_24]OGE89374.1 MAG: serine--tRNA ligase [Candidatus Doudnabacteria bacterium RIFCSPHIGHO2_01_FULL_50_67]OGE89686.1 MAG: serine--tRNA ligase [Candidatus Doudnabacteria bacterium RIFCSPHIGHO2_12_FULL_48_16]OGE97520.1 MAG: serine--tRNA ligase [Candidatus Doudnabacteria bacterium RIFCSPLOWO2_01_FULL_49_40]OGF03076.1 MAG: serine--tRNA ligase [Candidatus Doudnabacteria bacterium RIFCSPLOWO2_02_FULL_49_13]
MLDIKFIRDNQEKVRQAIKNKLSNANLDHLLSLDEQRKKLIMESESVRARRNEIAGKLKSDRNEALVAQGRELKDNLGKLELELAEVESQWQLILEQIPNVPVEDVPVGSDESANTVIKHWGEPAKFEFEAKDHMALGESLGIVDMERAAKVSGARFGFKKGAAAILEWALIQFVSETLTDKKIIAKIAKQIDPELSANTFVPVLPPVMIKPDVYTRTGRLSPEDADEKYKMAKDELYLIGSAEHTLVAMHMDEVLDGKELPIRYLGFSTCFRREAGSYGKDTKGMLRVHQFDKLEMESFSTPETSLLEHKFLVAVQEYLMQQLELPYQVVINCTGDMGKPNARQVDIETWLPGQNRYRETHSADYMTDYQARGLNIKFRRPDGSNEIVHTNDATAIAMSRIPIAIFENYQQADGSIKIPKVLQKYTGFKVIEKK